MKDQKELYTEKISLNKLALFVIFSFVLFFGTYNFFYIANYSSKTEQWTVTIFLDLILILCFLVVYSFELRYSFYKDYLLIRFKPVYPEDKVWFSKVKEINVIDTKHTRGYDGFGLRIGGTKMLFKMNKRNLILLEMNNGDRLGFSTDMSKQEFEKLKLEINHEKI